MKKEKQKKVDLTEMDEKSLIELIEESESRIEKLKEEINDLEKELESTKDEVIGAKEELEEYEDKIDSMEYEHEEELESAFIKPTNLYDIQKAEVIQRLYNNLTLVELEAIEKQLTDVKPFKTF